ncbi:MAG TPA: MmcQ/YjbR family DNA-binding protein [Steroidobacteraceae bacterium]|nr:MmcQ/YjbR family DNA-binding protein [Steroidobacteraceae bacterium]
MTLTQVRKFSLSLRDATEEPHFDRTSFRVNGRIFVTAQPTEPFIHIFVDETQREPALAMHPDCMEKLLWGGKVVGLRVALNKAPVESVKDLIRAAWALRGKKSRSQTKSSSSADRGRRS